jgi:hypothetical protein
VRDQGDRTSSPQRRIACPPPVKCCSSRNPDQAPPTEASSDPASNPSPGNSIDLVPFNVADLADSPVPLPAAPAAEPCGGRRRWKSPDAFRRPNHSLASSYSALAIDWQQQASAAAARSAAGADASRTTLTPPLLPGASRSMSVAPRLSSPHRVGEPLPGLKKNSGSLSYLSLSLGFLV